MKSWERLPDLVSSSEQQRNVTLHPKFAEGKYAVYTRPLHGFIDIGTGGGIGFGLIDDMAKPVVSDEVIINPKRYHTIYEVKKWSGPLTNKNRRGLASYRPRC